MKIKPRVSIVILNWNGRKDTVECLESLYMIEYPNYEVIVVDNNSQDDSIKKIKDWADGKIKVKSKFFRYNPENKPIKYFIFPEDKLNSKSYRLKKIKINKVLSSQKLLIIKNKKNYGFAKGNNIVIKQILNENKSKYILLLNNDTVVDKKFLSGLVKVAESDDKIAIIGPKIYYYDYEGKSNVIWFGGGKIKWNKYPGYYHLNQFVEDIKDNTYNNLKQTDWISGACMMINTENINPILDENYYFGCEDVDLCLQLIKKLKIIYVPKSIIWHKVGKSRKNINMLKRKLNAYIANIKFFKKHNRSWKSGLINYFFKEVIKKTITPFN